MEMETKRLTTVFRKRQWRTHILCILMIMVLALTGMQAVADGGEQFHIRGVSMHALTEGRLGVRFTVLDSAGKGVKSEAEQFALMVEDTPLVPARDEGTKTGYLFVIDISRFYADNDATVTKAIEGILTRLCNIPNDDDGILAIWTGEKVEAAKEYVSRVQGATAIPAEYKEKHKQGKKKDDALLYSAIAQAVNIAENPSTTDNYDYYHVIILSDGYNTQGNTGAASLNVIASTVQSSRPIAVSSILFYNRAVTNQNKLNQSLANRQMIQDFTESLGGRNYTIDYHREAELEDQLQQVAQSFAEDITGTIDITADISTLSVSRVPHDTSLMVVKGSQTASVKMEIPWNIVPTPRPGSGTEDAPIDWFARYGDSGSENVRLLQRFLAQKGWYKGIQDGTFNDDTRDAVASFYQLMRMAVPKANGEVGITESDWLNISQMDPFPTPTPMPPFATSGERESENVRRLQEFLKSYGYYNGEIDGNFYNLTSIAYQAFCTLNDRQIVRVNGNIAVSQSEWEYIQNIPATEVILPTPVPTATPVPEEAKPTPEPIRPLKFGDQEHDGDTLIYQIQKHLDELGYYAGLDLKMSDSYDEAMRKVIAEFNEQNHREDSSDGQELSRNDIMFIMNSQRKYNPSVSDKMQRFLFRKIEIGQFKIPILYILLVIAALLLVFIVLVIVAALRGSSSKPQKGKKQKPRKKGKDSKSDDPHEITFVISYKGNEKTITLNPDGNDVKTRGLIRVGRENRDPNSMLDIELDRSDTSASRNFAEFFFEGNSLIVRNVSAKMPILINGSRKIEPGKNTDETVMEIDSIGMGTGAVLPGDEVQLGKHVLKIDYKLPETPQYEDMPTGVDMDAATVMDMDLDRPTEGRGSDRLEPKTLSKEDMDGFSESQYMEFDR